ncbi:hypothetical protein BgiBS90_031077 [Biomphalaria glabrata]|nr:hypothetical protein BgiBS90_031077 [Biomphalaria glabrata]
MSNINRHKYSETVNVQSTPLDIIRNKILASYALEYSEAENFKSYAHGYSEKKNLEATPMDIQKKKLRGYALGYSETENLRSYALGYSETENLRSYALGYSETKRTKNLKPSDSPLCPHASHYR